MMGGFAGGYWASTSDAGLGYRIASSERTSTNGTIGFRPALPFMQEGRCSRASAHAMEKESLSRQDQTTVFRKAASTVIGNVAKAFM